MRTDSPYEVRLAVNGRTLTLKPFIRNMLTNVVLAMVGTLKVEGNIEHVELVITKPGSHSSTGADCGD